MLMKYNTGDSAEWIISIRAQFGGQVHGTPRLTALNTFRRQFFHQIVKIT